MPASRLPIVRPLTVRSRIVGLLTLLSLVAVLGSGAIAIAVERARTLDQIDRNLRAALESASFIVADGSWTSEEDALSAVVQRLAPDDNTGTLGIVEGRPAMVPGIATDVQLERLPGFVDRVVAETAGGATVSGTWVQDGRTIRYLAAPVAVGEPTSPPRAVFVTGYDVQAELAEVVAAAGVFLVTALIATAGAFLVGLVVSGRLLRPIRRMREVAERSSATSLSERIPVGAGRDDVSQLAVTVNGMLDRLGGALDSQRHLLRDVGHELKTPLTIVRGHLELVDPRDPAEVEEARAIAIDELDRMARMVDDLRAAARLSDASAFEMRESDVGQLIEQIAQKARAIDGAELDEVRASPTIARLDPHRITQAMLQLVANAVRHAQGPIAIGARTRGGDLELTVRDRGPGVPDELKRVIFERFQRGPAQGRGDGGSGLGLAIVALIAERHGGTAQVTDAGAGSEFSLTLPRAVVSAAVTEHRIRAADGPPGHRIRAGEGPSAHRVRAADGPPEHRIRAVDHRAETPTTTIEEQPWHRS